MTPVSSLARFHPFLIASLLASHAVAKTDTFRLREVRFFLHLFSDWVEDFFSPHEAPLQYVQIQRFMGVLVREGYARELSKGKRPHFRLTRSGLVHLVSEMGSQQFHGHPSTFLFSEYILYHYKERLMEIVQVEGRQYPPALKRELLLLLDTSVMIKRELERVALHLNSLKDRIIYSRDSILMSRRALSLHTSIDEVIEGVGRTHPYTFHSLKPLAELLSALPEDQRKWEITDGLESRIKRMWEPSIALLTTYQGELEKLLAARQGEQ
jgi:hypothetical protein